jgi:hypothetical protein
MGIDFISPAMGTTKKKIFYLFGASAFPRESHNLSMGLLHRVKSCVQKSLVFSKSKVFCMYCHAGTE